MLQKMLNQWDIVCLCVCNFGHQWLIIHHFLECVFVCMCVSGCYCQPSCRSPCVSAAPALCFISVFLHETSQMYSTCIQRGKSVHLMCRPHYCSPLLSYPVPFRHRQQQLCYRINVLVYNVQNYSWHCFVDSFFVCRIWKKGNLDGLICQQQLGVMSTETEANWSVKWFWQ